MLVRQGQQLRRQADVFVLRIALFVDGDDLAALDVGQAGDQLLQCCTDQFAHQFFCAAQRIHLGQCLQAGVGFQSQAQLIAGR